MSDSHSICRAQFPVKASRPVLDVCDLRVTLRSEKTDVELVRGVSFSVQPGRTLALVGESGAGKSLTSLAIMRLVGRGGRGEGASVAGKVLLDTGREVVDLLDVPLTRVQELRGKSISMIFQEPMTSLNPVFRIGWQIAETLVQHEQLSWAAAQRRALEMLQLVGIPDPQLRVRAYPHELSGGMRQRVMIAMALACRPRLLIADEPTTALDVTVQAQVLGLLRRLQREFGIALLFITHDLGVVAQMADDVAVMYAGSIVECGDVSQIFSQTRHPYTQGLLRSMPNLARRDSYALLDPIRGAVPAMQALPRGCAFHPRCDQVDLARCTTSQISLCDTGCGHLVRCIRQNELKVL